MLVFFLYTEAILLLQVVSTPYSYIRLELPHMPSALNSFIVDT